MNTINTIASPAELEHLAYDLDPRQFSATITDIKKIAGSTLVLISGLQDFDDVVVSINSQAEPAVYCLTEPIPDDMADDLAGWVNAL